MLFHRLSEIRKVWTGSSIQKHQKRGGEERKGCPVRVPGFQMIFVADGRARLKGCAAPLGMGQRQPSMRPVTQDCNPCSPLPSSLKHISAYGEWVSALGMCLTGAGKTEALSSAREITKYHRQGAPEAASCPMDIVPSTGVAGTSLPKQKLFMEIGYSGRPSHPSDACSAMSAMTGSPHANTSAKSWQHCSVPASSS